MINDLDAEQLRKSARKASDKGKQFERDVKNMSKIE